MGVACSGFHDPTRGAPQGGVLSPLLWILHINRLTESAKRELRQVAPYPEDSWAVIVQTFADDVSAAVGHCCRRAVIHIAWLLRRILLDLLKRLELTVSLPKRNNFLVECIGVIVKEDLREIALLPFRKKNQRTKTEKNDLGP